MDDLNELHIQLLDILTEFDRICRTNNIRYSLAYGTLLGAVRHKGFIPWDDDVDVIMNRKDFDKFNNCCNESLNKEYFFQSKKTEKLYPYNICRLRKNNTAMIYNEWKESGIHLGIYIDIYPIDNIPDNKLLENIQKAFIIFLTPIRISRNKVIYMNGAGGRLPKYLYYLKNTLYYFFKIFSKKICDKIENYFITKYDNTECTKCGIICEGAPLLKPGRDSLPFPRKYIENVADIEFEGEKFMAVTEWDAILTHWYGDYMQLPPVEERVIYHHPAVLDTKKSYTEYIRKKYEKETTLYK